MPTLVPFTASPPKRSRRAVPDAVVRAFTDIEDTLGGREEIIKVLASADLSEDLEEVLCAIADPTLAAVPLAELCFRQNILPGQLIGAYQQALIRKVQVTALTRVAAKIPDVVAEIARCALPHDIPCPRCEGAKTIDVTPRATKANPDPATKKVDCYRCAGKGTVQVEGSESQQDRLLGLAKLVDKGGGLSIINQTQVNTAGGSATRTVVADTPLGALQEAVSSILKGRRALPSPTPAPDGRAVPTATPVVDATLVEESADAVRLDD